MPTRPDKETVLRNQRVLTAHLERVRAYLEHALASTSPGSKDESLTTFAPVTSEDSNLARVCEAFSLSPFERDVVVMCAGIELDSSFAALCARANGDPLKNYPTFSLALGALPEAHWSALVPEAPLRHWRLVELQGGGVVTTAPLRINEHILHFLTATPYLDETLAGPVRPLPATGELVPAQRSLAGSITAAWSRTTENGLQPFVQLTGPEHTSIYALASAAARASNLDLYALDANQLPTDPHEFEKLQRAWECQALLSGCALFINALALDDHDAAHTQVLSRWMEETQGTFALAVKTRKAFTRPNVLLDVVKPTAREQRELWQTVTAERASELDGALNRLVSQFDLDADAIRAANADALQNSEPDLEQALWDACRVQARPRLDNLAMRIETRATWQDIVIPDSQSQILRDIALHVRQRQKVYETWGWNKKQTRGLGISALFAGASGTGKTMAGEVLANELRLDLYRIDLSAVVSKYIGETEKNLKQVFDAAEAGGAILLFDEADALFGKRSQVQDSHDRYANVEISYLLQRMEQYRGLAILTTNMQEALDKAFLRRIRFVVSFPFPDYELRREIWRRIFPKETPTHLLDSERLARLNIAGGNIRNIALNASFLAANENESVQMRHLLRAAQSEYDKMDKKLTETEIRDWKLVIQE